ncbi:uncharacterized protein [Littorina saxatilis]|uniref:uncharacterized protein n=1 Tax=Littorina saxatilis TaxID=31220 RepID=UPI0038B4B361
MCSKLKCTSHHGSEPNPFTDPGVIIGIIVGVTGVLVVVGVTILLCRLFCCKGSSCCSCCERGEPYQESGLVPPTADKDHSSPDHNPGSRIPKDHPNRLRKTDRSKNTTLYNPPKYDDLTQTKNSSWKVLDVNKYIKESGETIPPVDLKKNSKGSTVTNTGVDSPRALKYDFDDLENSPVVSRRRKKEPVVKSYHSPASSETYVGDISRREEDRKPFYSRREEGPKLKFIMSEFPSGGDGFQNSGYETRDSDSPPYGGSRGELPRVLPTGAKYGQQTSNMAYHPRGSDFDEDEMASRQYSYQNHNPNQPYAIKSEGVGGQPYIESHQQQPPHNRSSDETHRPSPRVMTNPKETYYSWDIDPSYDDGKRRVWDSEAGCMRIMTEADDPPISSHHSKPASAERYPKAGADNPAYKKESTETTV